MLKFTCNATIVTAAWPAVQGAGGAVVPGGQPWAAAALANINQTLAANTAALAAITTALAANTAAVNILLNRTSHARTAALRRNSKASHLDHALLPVPHPDTGIMPPPAAGLLPSRHSRLSPVDRRGGQHAPELLRGACPRWSPAG